MNSGRVMIAGPSNGFAAANARCRPATEEVAATGDRGSAAAEQLANGLPGTTPRRTAGSPS